MKSSPQRNQKKEYTKKMNWSFSEKAIILSCRLTGIICFEARDYRDTRNKIWVSLVPIFYHTFAMYCIISTLLEYHQLYSTDAESNLVAIDLEIVLSATSLIGRGFFYFIRRNELAALIWKVTFLSVTIIASRTYFTGKTFTRQ